MRLLFLLWGLAAWCGCGADDLDVGSKKWQPYPVLGDPGFLNSCVFDDTPQLTCTRAGAGASHVYRFDPATNLWDDYGQGPHPEAALYAKNISGHVYVLEQHALGTAFELNMYSIDDHVWTLLGKLPYEDYYFADDGTVWRFDELSPPASNVLRRPWGDWDDTHWETTLQLNDGTRFGPDATGHIIAELPGGGRGALRADGTAIDTYFACGTLQTPWCLSAGFAYIHPDGSMTFSTSTSDHVQVIDRVTIGGTPEPISNIPVLDDEELSPAQVFQITHDANDNAYMIYGMNNGIEPHFYVQSAGSTSWQEGPRPPVIAYTLTLSPNGDIFGRAGSLTVYRLE